MHFLFPFTSKTLKMAFFEFSLGYMVRLNGGESFLGKEVIAPG